MITLGADRLEGFLKKSSEEILTKQLKTLKSIIRERKGYTTHITVKNWIQTDGKHRQADRTKRS